MTHAPFTPDLQGLRAVLQERLHAQAAYARQHASPTAAPIINARLDAFREVIDLIDGVR